MVERPKWNFLEMPPLYQRIKPKIFIAMEKLQISATIKDLKLLVW